MSEKSLNQTQVCKVFADCGNSSTKVDCFLQNNEVVRSLIPTLISEGEDRMYQGSYVVKGYQGKNYVVGDENKSVNTNISSSKMDLFHKLPVLVAIHQSVPNNSEVELFVGLPIHTFYNIEYRKQYREYFLKEENVTLNVNNEVKTFFIKNVTVLPEGVGYVFNSPVESLMGVIDIGYTTIDGAVFKDCTPILETVFSLVDGANPFKTKLRDELNKELLLNIQAYQMDEILEKGLYGAKGEQAQKIIKRCQLEYLKRIVNEMLKHGWEIQTLPIVFSGGGSILLKNIIEEYETFMVSDNPIFDNLEGFCEMGMILSE